MTLLESVQDLNAMMAENKTMEAFEKYYDDNLDWILSLSDYKINNNLSSLNANEVACICSSLSKPIAK